MYIVLGVLYESYIHPITILSTLPSAGVGAILALTLFHMDLSVMALIGIILLIGIVKKNAIMMIDFALEAERKEGKTPVDAIYEACLLRFRPIMMTTFAALFGAVPLALGSGTGSELRRPLGITIIGGLLFSQVLTLYTTPVVYLWFDRLAQALRHLRAPKTGWRLTWRLGSTELISWHHAHRMRPVATTLLTIALLLAGGLAYMQLAGGAAAADRLSGDLGGRVAARRQSGDDGFGCGHAAGAAVRTHRRHQPDDLVEPAGLDRHHHAVRPEPQHRCRGARCAGRHQCGARIICRPTCPAIRPIARSIPLIRRSSFWR